MTQIESRHAGRRKKDRQTKRQPDVINVFRQTKRQPDSQIDRWQTDIDKNKGQIERKESR